MNSLPLSPHKKPPSTALVLKQIYQRLLDAFGPQHWWPAQTKFEVIVGAILTQNTNWGNVEKALKNLKREKILSPQGLHSVSTEKLARLIRPAGYFNIKANRLKNFMEFFFREYDGSLKKMQADSLEVLRPKLLSVNGIGPETADSILLYALDKPVFVIDAYTKRVLYRHSLSPKDVDYHTIQKLFTDHLSLDTKYFNEYHALIVRVAKDYCRTKARCDECPLKDVSYSLIYRCHSCYRYLPRIGQRFSLKEDYLCFQCQKK